MAVCNSTSISDRNGRAQVRALGLLMLAPARRWRVRSGRTSALGMLVAIVLVTPLLLAGTTTQSEIKVLSNRADLISGGDALVEVVLPDGTDPATVVMDLDGMNVTGQFAQRANGRYMGRLTGLSLGDNVVSALLQGRNGASITIGNHPSGGPIFSGPHLQPWRCTTDENGLGPAQDAQCNAPPIFEFFYQSIASGGFDSYDPNNPPPAVDIATTTTDQGHTVPYIVRVETGAINRGVYVIAVLFDPAQPWEPWAPQQAWNGKLLYPFGGGCGTNYNQGSAFPSSVLRDNALSRGFAVATTSLNVLGHICNPVLSAETVMMVKERIVEQYGEIRYTMGQGGSGGAIGQLTVTNSYPGLLQGLVPTATFPDVLTTGAPVLDCDLLLNYFFATSPHLWTNPDHRIAVDGFGPAGSSCLAWLFSFVPVSDPTSGCGNDPSDDYDPVFNPNGCRATTQDIQVSIWGRRPQDNFAKLAYDNTGVLYGFNAVNDGAISVEQFVDLNEKIGGIDIDKNFVPQRRLADPETPLIGHFTGQANDGNGLASAAIIDIPGPFNFEIHTPYHAFRMEERLVRTHGHGDNHAIWRGGNSGLAFETMDQWLTAIEANTTGNPLHVKVVKNRPASAIDSCFIGGVQTTDQAACDAAWPVFADPRIAAGAPLASDTIQCTLKPLDPNDFNVTFDPTEWGRLQAEFPGGVCDWSQLGTDQVLSKEWLTYENGPGGKPLGPAPKSKPVPSRRGGP
jgi:hypothetical protein